MNPDLTKYIDSLMQRFDSLQMKVSDVVKENEELRKILIKLYEHNKGLIEEKRKCENKK